MTTDQMTVSALGRWLRSGRRVVIATLVDVIGSAPLDPGALMLFGEQGEIEGSVTGGCVEGALAREAQRILDGDGAPELLQFGISDELAGDVGLMCGGTVRIFLNEVVGASRTVWQRALDAVSHGQEVALAAVLTGPHCGEVTAVTAEGPVGVLGAELLDHSIAADLARALERGSSVLRRYGEDGSVMGEDTEVFIRAWGRQPRLIIVGAIDFSVALAKFARDLNYATTIVDAREAFLASQRFTAYAEVVRQWPHEYLGAQALSKEDVILVFSHDSKFDEPALLAALKTGAGFIGAMGSRRTVSDRTRRLREAGVSESDLERIISPVGLDIGPATPAETAISILAEILMRRSQRSGLSLSRTIGSIRSGRADLPQQSTAAADSLGVGS